ncbi:inositol monophosphatase family protein [Chthonobacter albigriseus]|uniref:inositol monophosphatase family protein n=1 Tax=Chthonobacter albigriseus TaxID=1683161 RepID=UPI0015EF8750|nr:inositol monophosphatase [Chthonobacter albigriseus]
MTSTSTDLDSRFVSLQGVMRQAGILALEGFRKAKSVPTAMKGPQDYLTETDAAVERLLRRELAALHPGDGFIGEEEGGGPAGNVWVADPIDGTANFARGIPHFCISLAFVGDGVTELGAIYNPALEELWLARRGAGASLNGAPIAVADTRDFQAASIELGWSTRIPNTAYLDVAGDLLALGANVRRAGSGALGLAYVADGRQDGYAELHMNPWDCLAGLLLVAEAGGRVNDFLANGSGLASGNPVLAVTPALAASVSAATGIPLAPDATVDRAA